MKHKIRLVLFFLLLSFIAKHSSSQTIWENKNVEAHAYLARMAQKGLIQFNDIIQPIERTKIANALFQLSQQSASLTSIELKELEFYLKEYNQNLIADSLIKNEIGFFVKDALQRPRLFFIQTKDFSMNLDPNVSANFIGGGGLNITQVSNGLNLWGKVGKKWGYQLMYRDVTELGNVRDFYTVNKLDFRRQESKTGIILVGLNDDKKINHSDIRATINYSFKNGSISFGKDQIVWGYGENGRIVLSDRAPSFPLIRFDYNPIKWLRFDYFHGWLNSEIVDSTKTYPTNNGGVSGDIRIINRQKFIASHTLQFNLKKGLDLAIGESIIYSDQLDPGFLIPINLFKIYDNNKSNYLINAGSNGQYFLQLSSRNQIKNTHLYGSLFIDEIRLASIFNKAKSRNQLGYTIGGSVTDYFIPYLTIGAEYTRVNPFVYNNLIPAQTYTQFNYPLGDWMGSNFHRKMIFARYNYLPKLKFYTRIQFMNKGGEGSVYDQYNAEPQPKFLSDYRQTRNDFFFQTSYEWINNCYLRTSFEYLDDKNTTGRGSRRKESIFQIGFSYGLN
jgi:hypothetical protein